MNLNPYIINIFGGSDDLDKIIEFLFTDEELHYLEDIQIKPSQAPQLLEQKGIS